MRVFQCETYVDFNYLKTMYEKVYFVRNKYKCKECPNFFWKVKLVPPLFMYLSQS